MKKTTRNVLTQNLKPNYCKEEKEEQKMKENLGY
jgi:hypothetical protein